MACFPHAVRVRAVAGLLAVVGAGVSVPIGESAAAAAATARDTTIGEKSDSSRSVVAALRNGAYREGFRIGSLSGQNAFGLIESVVAGDNGRFFVLDSRNYRLRMYSTDGNLLDEVGGEGQGPGEFGAPADLTVAEDGRLLVTDRSRRVSIFRPVGDSLRYERRFRIATTPWDTCMLGNRLVVQALRHVDWTILDVYDFEGNRLRSFGEMSPGETLIERETFSWGHVACLASGRILYVPRHSNRVALYTLKGERLWQGKMSGYRPVTVKEFPGNKRTFQWTSPEGTHQALGAVPLPGGEVAAVHLGLRDTASTGSHDYRERRALFYDIETGELLWDTPDVPPFDEITEQRFYAVKQLPYPTITVFRIEGPGR